MGWLDWAKSGRGWEKLDYIDHFTIFKASLAQFWKKNLLKLIALQYQLWETNWLWVIDWCCSCTFCLTCGLICNNCSCFESCPSFSFSVSTGSGKWLIVTLSKKKRGRPLHLDQSHRQKTEEFVGMWYLKYAYASCTSISLFLFVIRISIVNTNSRAITMTLWSLVSTFGNLIKEAIFV